MGMSTYNFNKKERGFILKAVNIRRAECERKFYKKHISELDVIEREVNLELSKLIPKNKS
ncbi:hypothetical protein GCM10009122_24130 [Fulvivirga kasyanovii]